jgi:hypothetical protein
MGRKATKGNAILSVMVRSQPIQLAFVFGVCYEFYLDVILGHGNGLAPDHLKVMCERSCMFGLLIEHLEIGGILPEACFHLFDEVLHGLLAEWVVEIDETWALEGFAMGLMARFPFIELA